jgi:hypothetical protein
MVAPPIVGAARVAAKKKLEATSIKKGLKNAGKDTLPGKILLNRVKREINAPKNTYSTLHQSDNKPAEANFPHMFFLLALLKDTLDIPLELSIIGIVLTTILSFFIAVAIFFWCKGKMSGGWWKKKVIRWLWIRYVAVVILEFIPFFKLIPATTIFVWMVHNKEKEIVKLFNEVLETIKKRGVV